MKSKLLVLSLSIFAISLLGATPNVGGAETEAKAEQATKEAKTQDAKTTETKATESKVADAKTGDAKTAEGKKAEGTEVAAAPAKEPGRDSRCLASEEIIKDLEARETVVKQKEEAFAEREKDLEAQKNALKEEMAKLEIMRAEIQGIRGKDLAEREEKVNKLIETFESMSPKSASAVISKVDEELAVMALSRLTTAKAGKILAAMDPAKSSHLSEMIAFGSAKTKGKEKDSGESTQRAPANSAR